MDQRYGRGSWARVQGRIKAVIVRAINATRAELGTSVGTTAGRFQLFGADFIVDEQLHPVKAAVIPRVLDEAARMGLASQRGRLAALVGSNSSVFEVLINET